MTTYMFKKLDKYRDFGLLLLRVGVGLVFILIHGWPKLSGGAAKWELIGGSMKFFGFTFAPVFWGFMSAFTEFFSGVSLLLGLFVRPMMILLTINMAVALTSHLGGPWGNMAYAIVVLTFAVSMFIIGPGKYSFDK